MIDVIVKTSIAASVCSVAAPGQIRQRAPHTWKGRLMSTENNYWTSRARRRLGRRTFIQGAAAAGAGATAFGLVGCGGGSEDKIAADATSTPTIAAAATLAPKKGGVYNTGATGSIAGYAPFSNNFNGVWANAQVYNYLFIKSLFVPEAGIIYDLATAHRAEADQLTWTFTLRPDAKISPNKYGIAERPLDADDVKATFDFIADKKNATNAFQPFNDYFDKWDAPDKQTFRLVTKRPYAFTEDVLSHYVYCPIVPKEWVAKGAEQMKADAVGAGAWVAKEATEGQLIRLEPNPNYWDKGKPYLEARVLKQFADQVTYRTAFQAGQVDAYGPQNADEAAELVKAEKGVIRNSNPGLGFNSFWMNTKQKPWDDGRVRRAVNMAINRQEFIDIIGHGVGEPIGPITYAYKAEALSKEELAKVQPFDVAEAKKLFQAAGVTEFKFQHATASNIADYVTIFVRQMQAAGVTAKAEPLDAGTWFAQYTASTLTASLSQNQQYITPDLALGFHRTNGITGNNRYDTGFSDPEVDAGLLKAATTVDAKARALAYQDLQRLILKKDPALVNFFGLRVEAVHRDFIMNYPASGSVGIDYHKGKEVWINKA